MPADSSPASAGNCVPQHWGHFQLLSHGASLSLSHDQALKMLPPQSCQLPQLLRESPLRATGPCRSQEGDQGEGMHAKPHSSSPTHCLFINKRMPRLFWAPVIFYLNNQESGCLPASLPCSWRQNRGNAISPGVMGSGPGLTADFLAFASFQKAQVSPTPPPRGLGRENPGQVWMLWTRWFLPVPEGKSQLCHLPALGLWASDLASLSPSFSICKIGITMPPCRFGPGELPGS